jgi:cytochrome c biogenesis protein CcmG/thiol:disulfide interchange protein DsbE
LGRLVEEEVTMRAVLVGKGLLLLAMGVAVLTSGGCLGSDRNFSTAAAPASISGTPIRVGGSVGPKVGNQAPDFALKSLDGDTVRLSDLRGKPVIVNFWATWCPPCKEEMPDIEKSYQKHKDEGYIFLGVDMKEDAATVRAFVQNRYTWTFLLDPEGAAANAYYVTGVPETYFIDRDGIVRDAKIGAMSYAELESRLARIK